jgi:hypothetical protein
MADHHLVAVRRRFLESSREEATQQSPVRPIPRDESPGLRWFAAGHVVPMTEAREHAAQERHSLGEEDGPMEDALEAAFDRQVAEGVQRLGLVTLLRLVRSKDRIEDERDA